MHKNTVFIGVAVDNFLDRHINPLNYCESDLKSIYRLFNVFNLYQSKHILINDQACKSNILHIVNSYVDYKDDIILFFSTHGEHTDKDTYIFCNDTALNNLSESGISIVNLINTLSNFASSSINLFIDACDVCLTGMDIPKNITVHYPDKMISLEYSHLNHSLFVKNLLRDYSKVDRFNCSNSSRTKRYQRIRQNIANMFSNKSKVVGIVGKSGIGKSFFLRQIIKFEEDTYYISIPKLSGVSCDLILNLIAQEVSSKTSIVHNIDPSKYLMFFDSIQPYSLFIVDHIDHLPEKVANQVISFLKGLKSQVIISSRERPSNMGCSSILDIPGLSSEDVDDISKELNIDSTIIDSSEVLAISKNYIEILQNFYQVAKNSLSLNSDTVEAIISTGGYVNEDIFIKYFTVNPYELNVLKKTGVLIFHDNFYYPHDSLYEKADSDKIHTLSTKAYAYWKEELTYNNTKSVHQFILILNSFLPKLEIADSNLFQEIIGKLNGKQNQYFLLLLYDYLSKHELTVELMIDLSNSMINIGRFELAFNILKVDGYAFPKVNVLKAECLWWEGKFNETIELVNQCLTIKAEPFARHHLLCSRGIAYFFLGMWDKALQDLNMVVKNHSRSNSKSLFLSYCVLATIYGIRGTNFPKCTFNFIAAIKIASHSKNFSWVAIAYGNIGEIFWKAGMVDSAISTLEIAENLSNLSGNDALNLEINRNLLHAYNKAGEEFKSKKHINKLEKIYHSGNQTYVKMQLLNTMITYYVINNDLKYNELIKEADEATKENLEYQIYTIANLALVSIAQHDLDNAIHKLNRALELCNDGSNWLAMKQIMDDWDVLIKKTKHTNYDSKQVFPKWYQMLETKLSPYLHHLGHLNEYLAQPYTSW